MSKLDWFHVVQPVNGKYEITQTVSIPDKLRFVKPIARYVAISGDSQYIVALLVYPYKDEVKMGVGIYHRSELINDYVDERINVLTFENPQDYNFKDIKVVLDFTGTLFMLSIPMSSTDHLTILGTIDPQNRKIGVFHNQGNITPDGKIFLSCCRGYSRDVPELARWSIQTDDEGVDLVHIVGLRTLDKLGSDRYIEIPNHRCVDSTFDGREIRLLVINKDEGPYMKVTNIVLTDDQAGTSICGFYRDESIRNLYHTRGVLGAYGTIACQMKYTINDDRGLHQFETMYMDIVTLETGAVELEGVSGFIHTRFSKEATLLSSVAVSGDARYVGVGLIWMQTPYTSSWIDILRRDGNYNFVCQIVLPVDARDCELSISASHTGDVFVVA